MTPGEPQGRAISQFMWGYQHIFRSSAEHSLRDALTDIRAEVAADLFLVGFRDEPTPDSWPICIEPERGPYHPRHLVGVLSRAAELYRADPERQIVHSNRDLHESRQQGLRDLARARAIEEALVAVDSSFVFRVGLSAHLEGFAIHPVIRLNRLSWERLDRLNRTSKDRIHVTRSLADGVIEEIHRLIWKALSQPKGFRGLK